MTVAVAKILKPKESIVMVGPLKNKEDDDMVCKRLMSATGKKIVCGGTTSQVVARYLHEEIMIDDLLSFEGDVPPIARIRGIDLVTEGVLTLGKTLNYLKECAKSNEYLRKFMEADQHDGAYLLALMLIRDCSAIRFMIGTADNIAHASIKLFSDFIRSENPFGREDGRCIKKIRKNRNN